MPNTSANQKSIVVLYHAGCSDGFGAAYAARMKFGDSADYIPVKHNEPPPDVSGKEVYILDFSYKRDILLEMTEKAASLLVLDHHKTAQEGLSGLKNAIFDMNRSGCVIAWEYFHPGKPIPYGLRLIQDNDLWRFDLPETKSFGVALRSFIPMQFEDWEMYMGESEAICLAERGKDVLLVMAADIANLLEYRHSIELAGHKGLACNATDKYSSDLGNALAKQTGTYGVCYSFDGKNGRWQYSLRSIGDFDVGEIAQIYGGGGHKNASGFSADKLIGFHKEI